MNIAQNIIELIGETPIVQLQHIGHECNVKILVKLEFFNPDSSVKSRVAEQMIQDAETSGLIQPGATLIEATSGNTGIGLAMVAAVKGYKMMIVMPETMSIERQKLMRHLGAELILTPGGEGMSGAVQKAQALHESIPGSLLMNQFQNPSNPKAHRLGTAQEILRDTDGKIDIYIAGVGTGGSLCGTGIVLKSALPNIAIIGVEPDESAVLSGEKAAPHGIQGIGGGFVPANYSATIVNEICRIPTQEAIAMARRLAREEGILCGISSGANVAAALRYAQRPENSGKTILTLAPDTAERYLSTPLFS